MTTLDVTLSQGLQSTLDQQGIWAYAVYFDDGVANWTTLVDDGTIENSGTDPVTLPTLDGGKIYFIVQSESLTPTGTDPDPLPTLITSESEINFSAATSYDFRYDSFEVTLQNSAHDQGNLTSVNGFGLPMEVSIPYDNGTTATLGYNISGSSLVSDIQNIDTSNTYTYDYTSGPLTGDFRMAVSPTEAVSGAVPNPPFAASNWSTYITALEGPQAQDIVLSGEFAGAFDANGVWHNGGYFAYQLEWVSTGTVTGDGYFLLNPLASSQIHGIIQITPANLENSIYSTLGTVDVYANMADVAVNTPFITMNTGANNQWGEVLNQFLTGFVAGYYGTYGKSPNPQVTGSIDLDQNINWNPIYAFDQNLSSPPPSYVTADPYSEIFYIDSNSYGSNYTDTLKQAFAVGGPLISVSEPNTGMNVPDISLTIYADDETPAGYTAPQIYDYIAPAPGGYEVPGPNTLNNITLNFASTATDSAGVAPASTDTITLNILTSDAGGTPVWSTVTFDGQSAGPDGLWQQWTISRTATTGYTATANGGSEPAGTLLINDLPTAENGVSWYQIGVGSQTFNLYTTTLNGRFENPNYQNQQGALAVDGLAAVAPQSSTEQTITTFTVAFPLDPTLNTATIYTGTVPDAPVGGTLSDDAFTALAGQTSAVSNTITTTDADIAFAWTGENNNSSTASWISAYTNKINADDIALVTIASTGQTLTTTATADIDGEWQTGTVDLSPGKYTVTMQEYLPTDTAFVDPLTPASSPLILTEISCFAHGTRIATPGGEVAVEDLRIGDLVVTVAGAARLIRWVGRRSYAGRFVAGNRHVLPILIRQGALANDVPRRDLVVSPNHAMYIDGKLIPAVELVNGASIVQLEHVEKVEYFHIELETHDIILAEGATAETFVDDDSRGMFRNPGEYWMLYPNAARGAARYCAPRVEDGEELESVRRRLAVRAITALGLRARRAPPSPHFSNRQVEAGAMLQCAR